MTQIEKDIIEAVIENLDDSTYTSWESGDLQKWVDYARKEKAAIRQSIKVLQTLIKGKVIPTRDEEIIRKADLEYETSKEKPVEKNPFQTVECKVCGAFVKVP